MDRRLFMKLTLLGGTLTAAYQSSSLLFAIKTPEIIQDDYSFAFLTPEDRQVLTAIIPVVLGDALSIKLGDRFISNLKEIIRNWDTTLIHLPPNDQDGIRKLFDTIQGHALFRQVISAPMDFTSQLEVDNFLKQWSQSLDHIILKNELRYAYLAFCNITTSSWYSMQESWRLTEYQGMPNL